MIDAAVEMASTIASKSPVAVQGTKINLIYSRDHGVEESLHYQVIFVLQILLYDSNDSRFSMRGRRD